MPCNRSTVKCYVYKKDLSFLHLFIKPISAFFSPLCFHNSLCPFTLQVHSEPGEKGQSVGWVLARGWSWSSSRSCSLYRRCDYLTRHLQAWQRAGTERVKHSHFPSSVSTGPRWPAAPLRWERWLICHRLMPGLLPGHALALIWHCKQRKLQKASTLQDALSWAEQIKGVIMPRGRTQAPGLIWLADWLCLYWLPARSGLTLVRVKVNNPPGCIASSHTAF